MLVEIRISPILIYGKEVIGDAVEDHLDPLICLAQLLLRPLALGDVTADSYIISDTAGVIPQHHRVSFDPQLPAVPRVMDHFSMIMSSLPKTIHCFVSL